MAKIRFGYSDDFTAKNSKVGINTTDPQANLDVIGAIKGQDLKVTGISSQTGYEGFLRADHQIEENTQLNFGQGINASLSGEIIVGTGQTVTVTENLKEDRLGPELITNGQFLSNVDDWTAYTSVNSFNNGRLRIARSGGNGWATYQLITSLVPGATYFASAIVDSIGSRGDFRIVNGNSWTSNYYLTRSGTSGQVKILNGSFTATGTTALVGFAIDNNSTVIEVDQVTVRRVNDVEEPGTNVAGGSQVECMKVYNTFTPPSGDTNQRPSKPKPGQLYYNYDFKTIEFHDGYGWRQVDYTTQSGRGLIGGGAQPSDTNKSDTIESIQIQSLGRATDFGNLTQARRYVTSCSSSIRGIWAGGLYPTNTDIIDYVTIASGGNAFDFGNIVTSDGTTSNPKSAASSCSSSTRGIFAGGYRPSPSNGINYIEIATTGNALVFGELIQSGYYGSGCSSSVRGVFQGHTENNSYTNYEMITIASKGNAVDFGEANFKRTGNSMLSNSVRGINAGGYNALSPWFSFTVNSIEYITLSSSGSAEYFGDLTRITGTSFQGCATSARGVFCGGFVPTPSPGVYISTCDYVNIMTTGDAKDFGDLNDSRRALGQCSDSHGGLGGF